MLLQLVLQLAILQITCLKFCFFLLLLGYHDDINEVSLHPPHLTDSTGSLTPAALIPFCAYQTNLLGQSRHDLPFIACDKFKPNLLDGQLCYSMDVGKQVTSKTQSGMKNGLLLVIDPGLSNIDSTKTKQNKLNIQTVNLDPSQSDQGSARIYLNTLARFTDFRAGSYALSSLKWMKGTTAFINLSDDIKKCQVDTFEDCTAKRYLELVHDMCGCVPWTLKGILPFKVV